MKLKRFWAALRTWVAGSIGRKLALGYGLGLLLLLAVAAVGLYSQQLYRRTTEDILTQHVPLVISVSRVYNNILLIRQNASGYIMTNRGEYLERMTTLRAETRQLLEELRHRPLPEEQRGITLSFVNGFTSFEKRLDTAIAVFQSNPDDPLAALVQLRTADTYLDSTLLGEVERFYRLKVAEVEELNRRSAEQTTFAATFFIVVSIVVLLLFAGTAYGISRGITRAVAVLTRAARQASAGDLDVAIDVRSQDEIQTLAESFRHMLGRLRQMLQREKGERIYLQSTIERFQGQMAAVARGDLSTRVQIEGRAASADDPLVALAGDMNAAIASLQEMTRQVSGAASDLSSAASEILAATTQQATSTSEEAAAVTQASATIEEVRSITVQTAQRAQEVADLAQRIVHVAQSGQQSVAETIAGMEEVAQRVDAIARTVRTLEQQARTIGTIIASVAEIAAQSNILALNAAVEAARAGAAGRGFAVVAEEVRNLAEQSRTATVEIRNVLNEIQRGVGAVVTVTEEGRGMAERGVQIAAQSGEAIRILGETLQQSLAASAQIAAAANMQLTGAEEIVLAIHNIREAAAQNEVGMRQIEHETRALNDLAGRLRQAVSRYRL